MTGAVQEEKEFKDSWLNKKPFIASFFLTLALVLLGLPISFLIDQFHPLSETMITWAQGLSIVPGGTALLGLRNFRTWSGRTPAELLNQKLFIRFSVVGLFLPIVAFSLHPATANDLPLGTEERILQKLKTEILQELAAPKSSTQKDQ